jgi:hypothetical protein
LAQGLLGQPRNHPESARDETLIAIDHRDCGAAKVAYGDNCCSTPGKENATHKAALSEFRKQVDDRKLKLKIETYLMALDGTYIPLG